ncbi:MAG: glycosyltransferase, partial [Verrucomicrobiales bacterium]
NGLGNRDDLREILSISDLVLSLTQQPESFGRTTLEALSMGKRVAGYHHGGVAEQLDRLFPEGRIPALDVTAATKTIDRLLHEEPQVRKPNPFTLAGMLEGTTACYRELLTKG